MSERSESAWSHIGALIDPSAVRRLVGARSESEVLRLVNSSRLLGVHTENGSLLLPAFQFGERGVLPGLTEVLRVLAPVASSLLIASWFNTSQSDLDGLSPAEWLRTAHSPDVVVVAASRLAAQLAQ